jgi:hypothetical protein
MIASNSHLIQFDDTSFSADDLQKNSSYTRRKINSKEIDMAVFSYTNRSDEQFVN